jgi:hypothetical protein
MKKYLLSLLFLFIGLLPTWACHFDFSTENGKCTYKAGEELIITVKLVLTHRSCTVAAAQTKFKTEGMEVKSATPWKEISAGIWTRQVKVALIKNAAKTATLSATRSCDKDGGYGVFTITKCGA